jgi:hypothetical protein
MTLPASGPISFNNINVELGVAGTTTASLGQASYRTLAGVPSGAISMSNFYGKSSRVAITITLSSNQQNVNIYNLRGGSYVAGISDITVNVNSGVFIGATSTGVYAMTISGFASGDTVRINNSGTILGCGGGGGNGGYAANNNYNAGSPGAEAGPALSVSFPTTIYNYANIYGGGGGGGGGGSAYIDSKGEDTSYGGGGGGGGAGYSAGGGGAGGDAGTGNRYPGSNGSGGSTLSGGGGGAGGNSGGATFAGNGGNGGGNGSNGIAGANGTGTISRAGGSGGLAGYYIVGNGNVTWAVNGNRIGRVA